MNTIYFKKAYTNDGLLIVLTDLKDGSTQTINSKYPQVLQKIQDTVADCNFELSAKFYGMAVMCSFNYTDHWLFGNVYIKASSKSDFDQIEEYVATRLRKQFYDMGYSLSSELPED